MIEEQTRPQTLFLSQEDSRCSVLPRIGGSIASWTVGGQDMLRAASDAGIAAGNPYATAGFPLVPFSNRIGRGRFEWNEKLQLLARNFAPEPHAIHGVGFERPWQVETRSANSVLLVLRHLPDEGWPWAFEARQRITVGADCLTLDLSATNLESSSVPLSFGHHPYLPRRGARLQFQAQTVWFSGADGLPAEPAAPKERFDFSQGAPVERAEIDHCYCGWGRSACITWPELPWALEISATAELPCVVVYSSASLNEFCFEPVAHMNDAVNRRNARFPMPVIAPGESFSAGIKFRAIKR